MSADTQTTTNAATAAQAGGESAIVVDALSKSYGSQRVVDELTFTVRRGEVFALLGPNGAGKTTTIETLEGYRAPDSGLERVLGLDPIRQGRELKPLIGVVIQQDGLYQALNARELLHLFASYYQHPPNNEP